MNDSLKINWSPYHTVQIAKKVRILTQYTASTLPWSVQSWPWLEFAVMHPFLSPKTTKIPRKNVRLSNKVRKSIWTEFDTRIILILSSNVRKCRKKSNKKKSIRRWNRKILNDLPTVQIGRTSGSNWFGVGTCVGWKVP